MQDNQFEQSFDIKEFDAGIAAAQEVGSHHSAVARVHQSLESAINIYDWDTVAQCLERTSREVTPQVAFGTASGIADKLSKMSDAKNLQTFLKALESNGCTTIASGLRIRTEYQHLLQ